MKKRKICIILVVAMLLSTTALCTVASATSDYEATAISALDNKSDMYGTWKIALADINGFSATIESLEEKENRTLRHIYFILRQDGSFCYHGPFQKETGKWEMSENGLVLGEKYLRYNNSMLELKIIENAKMCFEKFSEDTVCLDDQEKNNSNFYGAWNLVSYKNLKDNTLMDFADVKKKIPTVANSKIVLLEDETMMVNDEILTGKWEYKNNAIEVDGNVVLQVYGDLMYLIDKNNGNGFAFEKEGANEVVASAVEPSSNITGIRPEFKEAMDAYEAFYDEYCNFMTDYANNPTDFNLLMKYMDMLEKVEEMDKNFDEWEDSDLSDEELQYYLQVTLRIEQKLLNVF